MTDGQAASPLRFVPPALVRLLVPAVCAALLAACGSTPKRGGYYQDDGPPDRPPASLSTAPDAEPRVEPLNPRANRPYTALGRTYTPMTTDAPFRQRGQASWYGRQFHGNRTSSGEIYDMYAMTAAHPTLPIPSYARITNARNGRSVIVRVNDRGPFKEDRVIDLSYGAATRLGLVASGTGEVEVERLTFAQIASGEWRRGGSGRDAALASATPPAGASGAPGGPAAGASDAVTGNRAAGEVAIPGLSNGPAASPLPTPPLASSLAPPSNPGRWSVQVGAFAQQANAEDLASRVAAVLGFSEGDLAANQREARVEHDENLFRVLVGVLPDRASALALAQQLERLLGRPAVPFSR